MPDWELRDPWFLLLAMLAPVVYRLAAGRAQAAITYSTLELIDQAPRSLRARLAKLPALLLALATIGMAVALAGPRTPSEETRVRRESIAIVMVVDRSGSMDARDLVKDDLEINRLDVVKQLFAMFVAGAEKLDIPGRPDDVIGLVAFARYADGLCPLTLDHGNLITIAKDLGIVEQRSEDGTAIGEGLALAVERLRNHPAASKIAIVLTDGVNNAGNIAPDQAAELAHSADVKVYCIGTGTKGVAPVPYVHSFTGQKAYASRRVQIDEETLKAIALKTDGKYFRATDAQGLAEIYRQIDELERTEITELRYLEYHEHFQAFVAAALACIAAGGLLAATFFRRLP